MRPPLCFIHNRRLFAKHITFLAICNFYVMHFCINPFRLKYFKRGRFWCESFCFLPVLQCFFYLYFSYPICFPYVHAATERNSGPFSEYTKRSACIPDTMEAGLYAEDAPKSIGLKIFRIWIGFSGYK